MAPWVNHDLRRTLSTGLNELGILPHVVEVLLGQRRRSRGRSRGTRRSCTAKDPAESPCTCSETKAKEAALRRGHPPYLALPPYVRPRRQSVRAIISETPPRREIRTRIKITNATVRPLLHLLNPHSQTSAGIFTPLAEARFAVKSPLNDPNVPLPIRPSDRTDLS